MGKTIIAVVLGVISIIASGGTCFSEPVPVRHDQPIALILEGHRVMSVSGDSFVYNLGNETIVITAKDMECLHFLASVRSGHRDVRVRAMLIPERKSPFNERYQAHLFSHHPIDPSL
jgi:hypothetical protein